MVDVVTARATGMRTSGVALRGDRRRIAARHQQVGEREVGVAPGILDRHPLAPALVVDLEVARVTRDGAIGRRDLDLGEWIVAISTGGRSARYGGSFATGSATAASGRTGHRE